MTRRRIVSYLRLGLTAALLLLSATAASAEIIVGPPIEVPTLPGYIGAHDSPSLAVLDDGSFAIGRTTYTRGFEILFYSPDGHLLRAPVIVYPASKPGTVRGGVGPFGDRYFVTWQVYGSGKASAAFYGNGGDRIGRSFGWPYSDTTYAYLSFHYARGSRGRILPFFGFLFRLNRFGLPEYAAWSRVFGPEARFLGRRITLLTERHVLWVEDAALNEEGRFVVAFLRCPLDILSEKPCTRGLQRFDGAWRPRSPLRSEGLPPVSDSVGPGRLSLALARTGDHLVTWVERFGPFPDHEDRVYARIFRRDGSPARAVLRLNGPGAYDSVLPAVRSTHERTFVVAWGDSPEGFGYDWYLREVDGRTGKLGEPILIANESGPPEGTSGVYGCDLQLNSSGRGVVWCGDFLRLVMVEPEAKEENDP